MRWVTPSAPATPITRPNPIILPVWEKIRRRMSFACCAPKRHPDPPISSVRCVTV